MDNQGQKRALLIANSASMIDHFNKDNIRLLTEKGYRITVAANFKEGNSSTKERIDAFRKELETQGIDIIDLPIPRKVTQLFKAKASIRRLCKYMTENPCQIVHTQTPFGGVVGRLAAKKFRKDGSCKVLYFAHGFHFFEGAPQRNYLIYYNIEKWLSRYTDCLITLNSEDYRIAKKKFKKTDVRYVPGVGVDTAGVMQRTVRKSLTRKSLCIPEGRRIVLNVAELIPRKDVASSLRAFAAADIPDAVLVVCGKGRELDNLTALAEELGVEERVFFAGYRTDILDIYHISDAFLFTSTQEGLSVGLLQAMATGLPIVASDIRGNRDLLNPCRYLKGVHKLLPETDKKDSANLTDNACLIPVGQVDAFAARLTEILKDDSLSQKLGQENYENCKKFFDISYVHETMSEIYDELTL